MIEICTFRRSNMIKVIQYNAEKSVCVCRGLETVVMGEGGCPGSLNRITQVLMLVLYMSTVFDIVPLISVGKQTSRHLMKMYRLPAETQHS